MQEEKAVEEQKYDCSKKGIIESILADVELENLHGGANERDLKTTIVMTSR